MPRVESDLLRNGWPVINRSIRSLIAPTRRGFSKQQTKLRSQEREPPREYLERESHYLRGQRYHLRLSPCSSASFSAAKVGPKSA